MALTEAPRLDQEPEPPRTVGQDVFKVSSGTLPTDSEIPVGVVVTAIRPGLRGRLGRRKIQQPSDRDEFLVRDAVAALDSKHVGFRIRGVGEDGQKRDIIGVVNGVQGQDKRVTAHLPGIRTAEYKPPINAQVMIVNATNNERNVLEPGQGRLLRSNTLFRAPRRPAMV